jgi:hypothetical protein
MNKDNKTLISKISMELFKQLKLKQIISKESVSILMRLTRTIVTQVFVRGGARCKGFWGLGQRVVSVQRRSN